MNSRHIPSEGRDQNSPFRGEQDTQKLVVRRFSALKPDREGQGLVRSMVTNSSCHPMKHSPLRPGGRGHFPKVLKRAHLHPRPQRRWPFCVPRAQPLSHVTPLCDPENSSPPGSSVHGILQARILKWIAMPSPRGSSQPRDRTYVSRIAGGFFTAEPPGPLCTACRTLTRTGSVSGAPPVCQGLGPQTGNLLQELSP